MKATKYFEIEELVPKEVFEKEGEGALNRINKNALIVLDEVREILGVPLICNNWKHGGSRQYCGYRQSDCPIGAKFSQHKEGNAFDLISNKMSAKEMRKKLFENQNKLSYKIRIEEKDSKGNEITWLHVDTKKHNSVNNIYFFKA